MKVLIQDQETGLYLGHQNCWIDTPKEAKDLAFTIHAYGVAKSLALKKFRILFYFPDINYQVVVSDCEPTPCTVPKI
jgi:hypothetical protein